MRFRLPRTAPSVIIPANALVPGGTGSRVAVARPNKKIRSQLSALRPALRPALRVLVVLRRPAPLGA